MNSSWDCIIVPYDTCHNWTLPHRARCDLALATAFSTMESARLVQIPFSARIIRHILPLRASPLTYCKRMQTGMFATFLNPGNRTDLASRADGPQAGHHKEEEFPKMRTGSRSPKILAASMQMLPLVFLVLCLAGSGRAQNSNAGDIRGTVTDATGAMIPGVNVTILDVDTGVTKELTTTAAGLYDAVSILPGKYKITFSKDGFDKYVRDGITLEVGLLTVNARLTVGTAQQQIEVTAEATLLKTETGEQSTSLEADVMVLLPNVGTNWESFTKIIPGASNWNAGDGGQSIAVNGNLPFYSNFLADGGSSTLPHSANFDYSIF